MLQIPAFAGMTWVGAGMMWVGVGMTLVGVGMTWVHLSAACRDASSVAPIRAARLGVGVIRDSGCRLADVAHASDDLVDEALAVLSH